MKKRLIALFMTAAMTAGLVLSGCGEVTASDVDALTASASEELTSEVSSTEEMTTIEETEALETEKEEPSSHAPKLPARVTSEAEEATEESTEAVTEVAEAAAQTETPVQKETAGQAKQDVQTEPAPAPAPTEAPTAAPTQAPQPAPAPETTVAPETQAPTQAPETQAPETTPAPETQAAAPAPNPEFWRETVGRGGFIDWESFGYDFNTAIRMDFEHTSCDQIRDWFFASMNSYCAANGYPQKTIRQVRAQEFADYCAATGYYGHSEGLPGCWYMVANMFGAGEPVVGASAESVTQCGYVEMTEAWDWTITSGTNTPYGEAVSFGGEGGYIHNPSLYTDCTFVDIGVSRFTRPDGLPCFLLVVQGTNQEDWDEFESRTAEWNAAHAPQP